MEALTWEAVVAILGSVVVITGGVFTYLIRIRNDENANVTNVEIDNDIEKIHTRVSEVKDRVAEVEKDIQLIGQKTDSMQKQLTKHEERDIRDFNALDKKIDKLTDIVMKILTDEKL